MIFKLPDCCPKTRCDLIAQDFHQIATGHALIEKYIHGVHGSNELSIIVKMDCNYYEDDKREAYESGKLKDKARARQFDNPNMSDTLDYAAGSETEDY